MTLCRAPHGARGLKQREEINIDYDLMSRPARGAWIETRKESSPYFCMRVAPHTGRVD